MGLPWDGLPSGAVGRAIDGAAATVGLGKSILKKPLIGQTASNFVSKSKAFPFKGVWVTGLVIGPVAALTGPAAPAVILAAQIKRWRSAGPLHPYIRSLGK